MQLKLIFTLAAAALFSGAMAVPAAGLGVASPLLEVRQGGQGQGGEGGGQGQGGGGGGQGQGGGGGGGQGQP
ncbi:hypothetical protein QBC34DRAFT_377697 [Podospora aff. communis PSN243]|uniref:Uncharacterized protein n=1 Tax=Podospora aff. communis PSN243 TaxID=3040156 RepID=A0AAV9GVW5_9PEZI|nr:hypothetical protein QBC34DRAFT_377697 [Podospora aff. communis PSN243]